MLVVDPVERLRVVGEIRYLGSERFVKDVQPVVSRWGIGQPQDVPRDATLTGCFAAYTIYSSNYSSVSVSTNNSLKKICTWGCKHHYTWEYISYVHLRYTLSQVLDLAHFLFGMVIYVDGKSFEIFWVSFYLSLVRCCYKSILNVHT